MTITSFSFFIFLLVGMLLFYVTKEKNQWIVLLGISIFFYCCSTKPYTIIFLVVSTSLAFLSSNLHTLFPGSVSRYKKLVLIITIIAIALNVFIWFLIKGNAIWISASSIVHMIIPCSPILSALPVLPALGMGYYTAQVIGYILDCYWGNIEPQKNILKLFLFLSFFPQLIVGPISRYSQMEDLYKGHSFILKNFQWGSQRILWGVFKKLVISDRIGIIVNGIWGDSVQYNGLWLWIAVFLAPLQIYTDFSGCMDIVLGTAELFDIHLSENFRSPFLAKNSQEFWQRWHITLGAWARDYMYYPILKSKLIITIGKWAKRNFSKRVAKLIPWAIGMGFLWFMMGFWHGSMQHILGVSLWFWLILICGEIFSPFLKKVICVLRINTSNFSWCTFQRIRTYLIYAVGVIFFSAPDLKDGLIRFRMLGNSFKEFNPWIFFDNSILNLGVEYRDINIIIISIVLLFIVDVLADKYGYARRWIEEQGLIFRWMIWGGLFAFVLVFGLYGSNHGVSNFIYAVF